MPNFHPILAGAPAVFIILIIIFELLNIWKKDWLVGKSIMLLTILGLLSILLAFISGYQALDFINRNCFVPEDVIARHHFLGRLLLFIFIPQSILCYFRFIYSIQNRWLNISSHFLLVISALLVIIIGYLGGQLVFKYGLAVTAACTV